MISILGQREMNMYECHMFKVSGVYKVLHDQVLTGYVTSNDGASTATLRGGDKLMFLSGAVCRVKSEARYGKPKYDDPTVIALSDGYHVGLYVQYVNDIRPAVGEVATITH